MSKVHKRRYSPTIDDIRQYNIKKVRLLHDFDSFSLDESSTLNNSIHDKHIARSDPYHEYIPDIEEFLLQNQDDDDIIQSSSHIIDLQTVDPGHIVIPAKFLSPPISTTEKRNIVERLKSKKRVLKVYHGIESPITDVDILHEIEITNKWSLIPYEDPKLTVFKHWEKWYYNVYRLQQFDSAMDDDLMIDDDIIQPGDMTTKLKNTYGGYYDNLSSAEASFNDEDDVMDID